MADKIKVIAICGPTATGKTSLSISLAGKFGGEIISADSMQVYRGLDIGTAKATREERRKIPHHLVDILSPEQHYSVSDFCHLAADVIENLTATGKIPFVVGGTGLYIESLLEGIEFLPQPENKYIRQKLYRQAEENGRESMHKTLAGIDPEFAQKTNPNDLVRVIRALEVYELTGKTMTQIQLESRPSSPPYESLIIGLNYSERRKLYEAVDNRVDSMVSQGLLREAEYVFKNRDTFYNSANAIGYKEFFPYFECESGLDECVSKVKQASRNYAKRQITWFRRMKNIKWLSRDSPCLVREAESLTEEFLS